MYDRRQAGVQNRTISWVHLPVKIIPAMTYNVSSGTLSLYSQTHGITDTDGTKK